MKYRTLGATGLKVSEIGLGAFPISGRQQRADGSIEVWSGTSDAESIALIHRCEELGVNLIDSAEGYGDGHSEELVGQALQGRRDKWIIATKVQPNRDIDQNDEQSVHNRIVEACENSLKRMQTDFIDIYQLHAIPHEWAMPAVMQTLEKLQREGKIRWYGISTNNREAIDKLRNLGPIHILQIGYNLLERSADELLHWSKEQNIGTLIRVPLAKGQLTGKYFGQNAEQIPQNDLRYERFQRPEVQEGLKKIARTPIFANRATNHGTGGSAICIGSSRRILRHCRRKKTDNKLKTTQRRQRCHLSHQKNYTAPLPIAEAIGTAGWIG